MVLGMGHGVGMNLGSGAVATVGRIGISATGALILSACFSEGKVPTEQDLDLGAFALAGGSDYAEERPTGISRGRFRALGDSSSTQPPET